MLPRSYYNHKLATQLVQWRRHQLTLTNVRTIGSEKVDTKEYKENRQAINVRSAIRSDNVILFDSCVRTGLSFLMGDVAHVGPYHSTTSPEFKQLVNNGGSVVPSSFTIDSEQRAKFLQNLGLQEDEVVAGMPLSQWYGFYLQQVA